MNAEFVEAVGMWAGLAVSLSLFSLFLGQHGHSRLSQHLFLGALCGYLLLMLGQEVLGPRMQIPLGQGGSLLGPILLTGLLAGGALTRVQDRAGGFTWLSRLAAPIGSFLIAAVLATVLIGVWRGTLLPQMSLAISGQTALLPALLTAAAIVSVTASPRLGSQVPAPVAGILRVLMRIGRPMLLLACGMALARLFTTRIALLTAFLDDIRQAAMTSGLPEWLASFLS